MRKSILLFLFLTGCAVGPDYKTPDTVVSDAWTSDEQANNCEPIQTWWKTFQDDLLNQYIEKAAACNYNIQTAEANILQARALRQIAASSFFPQAGLDVNATKTYFSKNGPVFTIGQSTGNSADTSSPVTGLPFALQTPQLQNLFNFLFDASWELDVFGKIRRTVEAAEAQIESAIAHRNDILISVFAEVAKNYIDLRSFQRRAELLQKNIDLLTKHAEITKISLEKGYANQLDLEEIEAQLAAAKAALPTVYSEIYRSIYTLSVLIGQPPETLVDDLLVTRPLPTPPANIAVGLRSDLLRRRPDIRYAERQLAEATAAVGIAVANFFPTVSLLANGGFQSLALPSLFNWGSRTWAYGADVNVPIFEGGQQVGTLRFTQASQSAAAAKYQQTVLSALQDAEGSLKNYQELAISTKKYDESVLHTNFVVVLTRERHLKGLVNLINLLTNEQQLVSTELTQLDSKTAELTALISLYKALGGGWECVTEEKKDDSEVSKR
ncbi:MAG: efflux transporter outer membrane subunit [Verrucomicrobiota bacterium]|nr:efflux transporter outer membrane subunit [Verrucomicrobiota bacterium]